MKTEKRETSKHKDDRLVRCPHCGSDKVWRIERNEQEKLAFHLSKGDYAVRKYSCRACHKPTLVHKEGAAAPRGLTDNIARNAIGYVVCASCGGRYLSIKRIAASEESAFDKAKKAFRKLCCRDCNLETIIYREDYEESIRKAI